ncbi:MAG: hypothetical protein PHH01_03210 [Patescibacteria group bacterium]|nr:hypothetical protein [Patescibacteria group bacterium]
MSQTTAEERKYTPRDSWGVRWPSIKEDGLTATGFGNVFGEQPCFTIVYNSCTVYLRKCVVPDLETARDVFRQLLPTLDGMWPNCGDRRVEITLRGKPTRLHLYFAFAHIDIRTDD